MFLDGEPVRPSINNFLTANIATAFAIKTGLSKIFIGGVNPARVSTDYRPFSGSMDNIRVWWPPCPGQLLPAR
eukprot:1227462-Rhodomonas_salina.4